MKFRFIASLLLLALSTASLGQTYPAKSVCLLAPGPSTVSEVLPGYASTTWYGLYGPKDFHADISSKLNQAVNAALADTDVKERFARLGAETTGGTSQAFAALVSSDTANWKKIITDRKITTDY